MSGDPSINSGNHAPARPGLVRASATYAVGSIAGKAIGAFLLPILTRGLTPGELGRYDLLSTLASAVVSSLVIGLDVATMREAADSRSRESLVGTWLAIATALALPAGALLVALSGGLSNALFGDRDEAFGVMMVGLVVVAHSWLLVALTTLRIDGRPFAHAAISAGLLVVNAVLIVALFAAGTRSVGSVMTAMAVSYGVGAMAALIVVRSRIGRPDTDSAKRLLRVGLPLAPSMVAVWISDFGNRAILLAATSTTAVGLYAVGFRIASLALLVVTGIQLAWQPHAFSIAESPGGMQRLATEARLITNALCTAAVMIAAIAPEALRLVAGAPYEGAASATRLLTLYALGTGILLVATMPSAVSRRMRDVSIAGLVTVIATLAANLYLARRYGIAGTAAAYVLGQAVGVVTAGVLARHATLRISWVRMLAMIAITAAVVTGLWFTPSVTGRLALVVVFLAATYPEIRHAVGLLNHAD